MTEGRRHRGPPVAPAAVWDRLAGLGWHPDRLELLSPPNQGERNQILLLRHSEQTLVVRLPPARAARDKPARLAREMHNLAAAAGAGVTPTPLLADATDGLLVLPFVDGHHPQPGTLEPAAATRIGRCLRRLHRETAPFQPGTAILKRISRRLTGVGKDPAGARVHAPGLPSIARIMMPVVATLERTAPPPVSCHGDLVPGNIIDTGTRAWLIDWETSRLGDPHQDIGNVCLRARLEEATREQFLDACLDGEPPFDAERARARIRLWEAACALDKALTYWRNGMRSGTVDARTDGWTRRCSALLAAPGTRAAALFLDTLKPDNR